MQGKVFLLLGASKEREGGDDAGVGAGLMDREEGHFGENKRAGRDEGGGETAETLARRG